jgi:biopolymer transport protein TolR
MSMNVGGSKGGPVSEINVTPLVDIMLVLLIIMMLIAPLLQKGVNVRLPTADHVIDKPDTQQQTVVHVTASKEFYVNNVQVNPRDLVDRIKFALEEKKEKVVYLKADADAPYGSVMTMMDQLREAQIENVGLITETRRKPGEAGAPTGGN